MAAICKLIITILVLSAIVSVTDANRARRRRRQTVLNAGQQPNPNSQVSARQQSLSANLQGQFPLQQQQPQQFGQSGVGLSKDMNVGQNQAGRQYYGYPNQFGSGSNYYPYGGNQYGAGQYPQYGQGGSYGSYYNQNPGSNSFYSNPNMNYYNRPGYGSNNNYYPGSGTYGGQFWNAGQKQSINIFTVFFSSFLALVICLITV